MFAVINHKGNQYKVEEGKEYKVDLLDETAEKGNIVFPEILLSDDGKTIKVGTPNVENAFVEAEILSEGRYPKVTIAKFHRKTRYSRKKGHRQDYTLIKIKKISA